MIKLKKKSTSKKPVPFDFVLELLAKKDPYTKPMFGCTSVYVGNKIVLILRDRGNSPPDDGVWIATTVEHHESLRRDFPSMRDIQIFGPGPTGWQVLPADASDFEESVHLACELILAGDTRIGKVPKARTSRSGGKKAAGKKPAGKKPAGKKPAGIAAGKKPAAKKKPAAQNTAANTATKESASKKKRRN